MSIGLIFFFSVFLELIGPFGGDQASSWSDVNHSLDFGSITKVQIRSGGAIDAIRLQYGATWGPWHGGNGGVESKPFELHGEKIIKIQGTSRPWYKLDNVIGSIEFYTNQGRKFGKYGDIDSNSVPWAIGTMWEQCALTWIAGYSPKIVQSLSFNFQC